MNKICSKINFKITNRKLQTKVKDDSLLGEPYIGVYTKFTYKVIVSANSE